MSTPMVSPSLIDLTFAVHTWQVGLDGSPGRHAPGRPCAGVVAGAGGAPNASSATERIARRIDDTVGVNRQGGTRLLAQPLPYVCRVTRYGKRADLIVHENE